MFFIFLSFYVVSASWSTCVDYSGYLRWDTTIKCCNRIGRSPYKMCGENSRYYCDNTDGGHGTYDLC